MHSQGPGLDQSWRRRTGLCSIRAGEIWKADSQAIRLEETWSQRGAVMVEDVGVGQVYFGSLPSLFMG